MPVLQPLIIALMMMFAIVSMPTEPEAATPINKEVQCLADNIYHEARGEPKEGQWLVGQTVLNRVEDRRWEPSICGVVYQRKQFSWTNQKPYPSIKDKEAYKSIYKLSQMLVTQGVAKKSLGANHYLRCDWCDKVNWWKSMTFVGQVGNHCFYRG